MRSSIEYLLLLALAASHSGCVRLATNGEGATDPGTLKLETVMQVKGRQGVAFGEGRLFVSGSKALYTYDLKGNLLMANEEPFRGWGEELNHLGDIDYYKGEIYAGAERFERGRGWDIQIAVFNAKTLQYRRSIVFHEQSGQEEVCGITIDPQRKIAWMSDWTNGRYLYQYDLTTEKYIGRKQLIPVPSSQQGICYHKGQIYISADDGDADLHEPDHLYRVSANPAQTFGYVERIKAFEEFTRAGEIEGLCFSPGFLLVLMNRGSRIIEGKVAGLYPGYEEEIHEVYVYSLAHHAKQARERRCGKIPSKTPPRWPQ